MKYKHILMNSDDSNSMMMIETLCMHACIHGCSFLYTRSKLEYTVTNACMKTTDFVFIMYLKYDLLSV